MRITTLLSFVVVTAATLPAEAYDLPEHTVLAFNLSVCPKGWVEYAPAAGALVCKAVHHPGVAVEVEDDGGIIGEDAGPLNIRKAVGVVTRVDKLKEIDNVDAADLELREVLKQEIDGSQ